MGYMKELDIRLRSGGDDAVAAFNEYVTIAGTVSAETGMGAKAFEGIPDGYKMQSIGWVSVSERLPEEGQEVLWYSSHDRFARWRWATGKREGDLVDWGGDLSAKIDGWLTHWMPLPEPPA
jgi:hypothetical protein